MKGVCKMFVFRNIVEKLKELHEFYAENRLLRISLAFLVAGIIVMIAIWYILNFTGYFQNHLTLFQLVFSFGCLLVTVGVIETIISIFT
jgi:hypothetical protein